MDLYFNDWSFSTFGYEVRPKIAGITTYSRSGIVASRSTPNAGVAQVIK